MSRHIREVAVLGAGTMGAQIAAHFANAGVPALLLDVTREAAREGLERCRALRPDPFFTPSRAHPGEDRRLRGGPARHCDDATGFWKRSSSGSISSRRCSQGRVIPARRYHRQLQYLGDSNRRAVRWAVAGVPPSFSRHPFLQSAEIFAIARSDSDSPTPIRPSSMP